MENSRSGPLRARQLVIDLAVMVGIGVLLAMLGPFGSFAMPFALRLAYWLVVSVVGYVCYVPIVTAILRAGDALLLPHWISWIGAMLLATLPMTAIIILAAQFPDLGRWPSLEASFAVYLQVLVIGGFVALLLLLVEGYSGARQPPLAVPPTSPPAPPLIDATARAGFLDRLPAELGSDLIALEMEDHYVRAHTALGSDLVLMRMRDAVGELGGIEGLQIHRSWWVARHAVSGVRRDGRNIRLVLDTGIEAPVSRGMLAPLKDAGWI